MLSQNQQVRNDFFGYRQYSALAKHIKPFLKNKLNRKDISVLTIRTFSFYFYLRPYWYLLVKSVKVFIVCLSVWNKLNWKDVSVLTIRTFLFYFCIRPYWYLLVKSVEVFIVCFSVCASSFVLLSTSFSLTFHLFWEI